MSSTGFEIRAVFVVVLLIFFRLLASVFVTEAKFH